MKKTSIAMALAAALGLALAAIPALAAVNRPATEQPVYCPFHDEDTMTYEGMSEWMDSGAHDEWMSSAGHDRMHATMRNMDRMMPGYGAGPGNMMGGHMMGLSR